MVGNVNFRLCNQSAIMELHLTPQEMRVLSLCLHGLSYDELAYCLKIETSTVSTHLRTIRGKMQVSNHTSLVVRTIAMGFDMVGCFKGRYLFDPTPERSYRKLPWEKKKEQ